MDFKGKRGDLSVESSPQTPFKDFQLGRGGPLRKGASSPQIVENFWRVSEGTFL
jgi:hypothetical protein